MTVQTELLPNHTLTHWRVAGIDLLFPLQEVDLEMRGGAPVCAPMFSVQQRPVPGCRLPLHGILIYRNDAEVHYDKASNTWTTTTIHTATEQFAWDFTATTRVTIPIDLNSGPTLLHELSIKRLADCRNPNDIPLSLGFHPYFNTFGEDFYFIVNDKITKKADVPESIIDSDFAPLADGQTARITTVAGTISITPNGFDEWCLWTDNLDQYFCIEPIYQYREFGLAGTGLTAGATKTVSCQLQFIPVDPK